MSPIAKSQTLSGIAPVRCHDMTDVRREIDRVDRALVDLLLERLSYIEQAGVIKQSRGQIRDNARIEDVIAKVLAAARLRNGNEAMVEDVFRYLIEWSIAHEFKIFDAR